MTKDEKDVEKDEELATWLRLWGPPPAPARLGERLKASYRSRSWRAPSWRRLLEARVSLPLPVAALVVGLLLGIGILAGARLFGSTGHGVDVRAPVEGEGGLANLRPLPEIRVTVLKRGGASDDPH